jgi:hypothetical protein
MAKLRAFLADELARKEGRRCVIIELFYAHGEDYRNEEVRSWTRDEHPEIFEDLFEIEQLASAIFAVAKDHSDAIMSSRRYVVRSIQYLGDRQTCNFKLPPISRVVAPDGSGEPSIRELRGAIAGSSAHADRVSDLTGLDLPNDDVIGVWHDLERALAGKNGYGGDVAEIYAYRLVPQRLRDKTDPAFITGATEAEEQVAKAEAARVAGANMTLILRYFAELHERVIFAIEGREGFRTLDLGAEEFPPFDWRVQLRVAQGKPSVAASSIHELRQSLSTTVQHAEVLTAMLDELAALRAKDRLHAAPQEAVSTADLPPDGATGLYLDRALDAEDLEWIKMAWDAYLSRGGGGGPPRPAQLMLVFQAIRRDERSTAEFLRVMNTIVLPLCRRLRLKEQPHLTNLGAASE